MATLKQLKSRVDEAFKPIYHDGDEKLHFQHATHLKTWARQRGMVNNFEYSPGAVGDMVRHTAKDPEQDHYKAAFSFFKERGFTPDPEKKTPEGAKLKVFHLEKGNRERPWACVSHDGGHTHIELHKGAGKDVEEVPDSQSPLKYG